MTPQPESASLTSVASPGGRVGVERSATTRSAGFCPCRGSGAFRHYPSNLSSDPLHQAAQELGFSLDRGCRSLDLEDGGRSPLDPGIATERGADEHKVADLRRMLRVLKHLVVECEHTDASAVPIIPQPGVGQDVRRAAWGKLADGAGVTALASLALLLPFQASGRRAHARSCAAFPGPVSAWCSCCSLCDGPGSRAGRRRAELLLAICRCCSCRSGRVITHLDSVSRYGPQLLAVIVLSTWIGMAVTHWCCAVCCATRRRGSERRCLTSSSLWVYLSSAPLFVSRRRSSPTSPRPRLRPRRSCALANPCCVGDRPRGRCSNRTRIRPTSRSAIRPCLLGPRRGAGLAALAAAVVKSAARRRVDPRALVGGATRRQRSAARGLFAMPPEVVRSLAAKSVTAPVAMGIAERIGGVPALAAVFAVATGLVARSRPSTCSTAWASRAGRCALRARHDVAWPRPPRGVASARRRRRLRGIALGLAGAAGVVADSAAVPLLG